MNIYNDTEEAPLQPIHGNFAGEVVTVLLDNKPGPKRNFRCLNCGKIVFQFEGGIKKVIMDGAVPLEESPLDNLCPRCKITYRVVK